MDRNALTQKLGELDVDSEDQAAQLGKEVAGHARDLASAVIDQWTRSTGERRETAQVVLQEMRLQVLHALSVDARNLEADDVVWLASAIVDTHVYVRERIAAWLDALLDDPRTLSTEPDAPRVEEPIPLSRVSDEAYLLMRRLLNVTEELESQLLNEDAFLNLPFELRSAEIKKVRESGVWSELADAEVIGEPDED